MKCAEVSNLKFEFLSIFSDFKVSEKLFDLFSTLFSVSVKNVSGSM